MWHARLYVRWKQTTVQRYTQHIAKFFLGWDTKLYHLSILLELTIKKSTVHQKSHIADEED